MSHLSDATRALEIADARLVAVQSRLVFSHRGTSEIVRSLDQALSELREAATDIASHDCMVHLPRKK